MAVRWAVVNGNWSNTATWNGGTLPDVGDDVHADGKTVTIDQDVTVASIRTTQRSGGLAGGGFNMSSPFNGSADIIAGTTVCLTYTANGANWIGNVTAGSSATAFGVNNNSTGTINITGNVTAGSGSFAHGVQNTTVGTINLTGNLTAGNGGTTNGANNSIGTINITGNATGGFGSNSHGVRNEGTGTINITGNATGGFASSNYGALNNSTGTINITGNATGGTVNNAHGAFNNSTGILIVTTATAINILASGIVGNNQGGLTKVKNIVFGSAGQTPVGGFIKFDNGNENTVTVLKEDNTQVTLIDLDNLANELPSESDVRQGTVYNSTNKTGTLIVPSPSNVRKDIPTDNTVGTAELTGEDILQALNDSMLPLAVRLKNVATVQSTGDQITSI